MCSGLTLPQQSTCHCIAICVLHMIVYDKSTPDLRDPGADLSEGTEAYDGKTCGLCIPFVDLLGSGLMKFPSLSVITDTIQNIGYDLLLIECSSLFMRPAEHLMALCAYFKQCLYHR